MTETESKEDTHPGGPSSVAAEGGVRAGCGDAPGNAQLGVPDPEATVLVR